MPFLNKENQKEYNRKYREINKEKLAEADRQRYLKKKDLPEYKETKQKWHEKDKENRKYRRLNYQFGITEQDYLKMLEKQNRVCAICNKPETQVRQGLVIKLAVDHCHKTGIVRGLLCTKCNKGLGMFLDNSDNLIKASEYLNQSYPK